MRSHVVIVLVALCAILGCDPALHVISSAPPDGGEGIDAFVDAAVEAGAPVHQWSLSVGGSADDRGHSVAIDGQGNIFVTGAVQGAVDFGGGPLMVGTDADIFLASYDASGAHRWSKVFGTLGHDYGFGVAVDDAGHINLVGSFAVGVDFGGGALASAGSFDAFVASFDAGGTHRWSKRFGGSLLDQANGVAVDGAGNIVITGEFRQSVDFGGGWLAGAGESDAFLVSLDSSGAHRWSRRLGGLEIDHGQAVAMDASGKTVFSGHFYQGADFGGGVLTSAGQADVVLASYDADGAHLWSKRLGGTSGDTSHGVAVGPSGTIALVGHFQGTADFGGAPLRAEGGLEGFVASYAPTGTHRWSKRLGGPLFDIARGVAVDGVGNLFIAGSFGDSVDFGGGPLTSAGNMDVFVAGYGPSGQHRFSQRFGGALDDSAWALAVGADGALVVTGEFQDTVDFGGGPLTRVGGADVFLLQLAPAL